MRALRPCSFGVLQSNGLTRIKLSRTLASYSASQASVRRESQKHLQQKWATAPSKRFSQQHHCQDEKLRTSKTGASPPPGPTVNPVPEEILPSHREKTRLNISRQTHVFLDDLLQRLAMAGQQINNYTGTDYTGIEALRREIKEQGTAYYIVRYHVH
jgi:hypothetical protein